MSFSPSQLATQLTPFLHAPRWLVAYSGGVDSHVLLHSLMQYPDHPPIEAIHINHQLQAEADSWADHCQQQADQLNIPLHTQRITLENSGNLEQQARQARYQAFESVLNTGDILMLGHHLDDQAETLMLRLLRGSGSRGAAAMPASRPLGQGQLARPLLDIPRSVIKQYAEDHQLRWIEDPSNQCSDYDRNFLRLQLLPALASRWPAYRQTLARAASLSGETADLTDELALLDFERAGVSPQQTSIPITLLENLSRARQKNLLRYWLRANGFTMPSVSQLGALLDQALNAEQQAQPLIRWGEIQIRRFNGALFVMNRQPEFDSAQIFNWDLLVPLQLEQGSRLLTQHHQGRGINLARLNAAGVTVRFRQGGERCQPAGRAHSQSLKKLFQEYQLAPWLRDRAPLLYCGDDIVAVADLWVCEGWEAGPADQGVNLIWEPDHSQRG